MRLYPNLLLSFLAAAATALGVPVVQYNFTGDSSWNQFDVRFRDVSHVADGLSASRIERPDTADFGHFIQGGVGSLTDRYLTTWRWYPTGKYYEFSVTVEDGRTFDLDSISFLASTNLPAGSAMALSISYADNAAFTGATSMGSFNVFSTLPIQNPFTSFDASANAFTGATGTTYFRIYNTVPAITSAISYGLYLDSISLNGRVSASAVPDAGASAALLLPVLGGLAVFRGRFRRMQPAAVG